MNRFLRAVSFLAVCSSAAAFAATAPTLTPIPIDPATNALGSVVVSATVTANGGFTTVVFSSGKDTKYGTTSSGQSQNADAVGATVSITLSGLIGGETYHYKITATNPVGSATTADMTFVASPYPPLLGVTGPTAIAGGNATLHGTVTANGWPGGALGTNSGTIFFQYDVAATSGAQPFSQHTAPVDILNNAMAFKTTATVAMLTRNVTYSYRLAYQKDGDAAPTYFSTPSTFTTTNNSPKAKADYYTLASAAPVILDVLKNDTDPDGDTLLISAVTTPQHGTATTDGSKITYTPGADFVGTDSFTYTAIDPFGATGTATVTISSPRVALAGTHGGFVYGLDGKEVGYFRFGITDLGAFTGTVLIEGEKYRLAGAFSPEGHFTGTAYSSDGSIAVDLNATQASGGTGLAANFDGGKWHGSADFLNSESNTRQTLAGRYNIELPAGSTGTSTSGSGSTTGTTGTTTTTTTPSTDPQGTGWATVQVLDDGSAQVKGRLPDGRSFSTSGVLTVGSSGSVLTFFDDPKDTSVVGTLTLGGSATGTVRIIRDPSNDDRFSAGYDITQSVTGTPFFRPSHGERTLSNAGESLTVVFSGTDLTGDISRNLQVSRSDKIEVLNGGPENLQVKIDRHTGRFETTMDVDSSGRQLKGTGVLIQGSGTTRTDTGAGIFTGPTQTGRITISETAATSTTTTGTTGTTTTTPTN